MAFFEIDGFIEDGMVVDYGSNIWYIDWNKCGDYKKIGARLKEDGVPGYPEKWGAEDFYSWGEIKREIFRGKNAEKEARDFYKKKITELSAIREELKEKAEEAEAAEKARKEEQYRKWLNGSASSGLSDEEIDVLLGKVNRLVETSAKRALRPGEDSEYYRTAKKLSAQGISVPELQEPPAQILEKRMVCKNEEEEDRRFYAILKECGIAEEDMVETDIGLVYENENIKVEFEFIEPFGFDVKIEAKNWFGQFAQQRMGF